MTRHPFTRCLSLLLLAGCAGAPGHAATGDQASAGAAIPAAHKTLTGRVRGERGGDRSVIKVTDAERSLPKGSRGALIALDGIGVLRVACTRHPHAAFVLTRFAAGEGPPTVQHDTARPSRRASISGTTGSVSGLTGQLQMRIPRAAGRHAVLEHWEVSGGGEAFQFVASISDLLGPAAHRCDLLAQATVVTHGPFYRYAHSQQ
ncbi:MAG TPA: hypothetical protein VGI72_04740 [Gaiellales bacterium]|jgi:hypothetical protein